MLESLTVYAIHDGKPDGHFEPICYYITLSSSPFCDRYSQQLGQKQTHDEATVAIKSNNAKIHKSRHLENYSLQKL